MKEDRGMHPSAPDGLLPGGFLPHGAPEEVYLTAWRALPIHAIWARKLRVGRYEWAWNADDERIGGGIEKSKWTAYELRDFQIARLAVQCLERRVGPALLVAGLHGYVHEPEYPPFLWEPLVGGIINVNGVDLREPGMRLGVIAKYRDSVLPLIRIAHHEQAKRLLLALACLTNDLMGVQTLAVDERQRKQFLSLTTSATHQERSEARPLQRWVPYSR